ncbi:type II toxin-antitoxin system RelE/ParE family toxin [Vitreimonas sp.]|uniref:type II toxin-antitoxin system RelE/ParE family toxin n=1 Tax=Vitreimonas sp. TaxID=3069702 RepID=UPI0039C922BA
MQVVWDDGALDDLESIGAFIARDNPRTARRIVEFLRDKASLLATFPYLGVTISTRSTPVLSSCRASRTCWFIRY